MKRVVLKAVVSGFIVLSAVSSAFASLSIPAGWYVEGNVGTTKLLDQNTSGSVNTSGLGFNANVGYKFMPYLSGEFGYTQYADSKIKDQFATTAATNKHYSYDVAIKGIVPIVATGIEAFAKVGVQRSVSKMSIQNPTAVSNIGLDTTRHTHTGLYIGAGAEYYFMPELAGNIQWASAKNDSSTGTLDLYSVGLSILFE